MSGDVLSTTQTNEVELLDYRGQMIKPGDRVMLRAGHPHAGKVGTYKGVESLAGGLWGSLVRFDDGAGCYVFKAHFWERVR